VIPGGGSPGIVIPGGGSPGIVIPGGGSPGIVIPGGGSPGIVIPGGGKAPGTSAPKAPPMPGAEEQPISYQTYTRYTVYYPRVARTAYLYVVRAPGRPPAYYLVPVSPVTSTVRR
jgi:hypothetical protein